MSDMKRSPYRAWTAAFTLIELLVVIALLGLVIAAVLVGMNGAKRKAYDTKALACSHDIHTAQEQARTADQIFRPYAALGTIRSCDGMTPEGNANTDHFLYAVKHPRGQVTYTVTDTDTYAGGTAKSGALLANDPAQLVLGAGGTGAGAGAGGTGGGPGSPTPTTEADCTAQGGVFFQTTYGNVSMPICQRPVDCPTLAPYTPAGGTPRTPTFISGVGCSYATRRPTVTLDFNDPSIVESLSVNEGFDGREQSIYDGGPTTYRFATRPAAGAGFFIAIVRIAPHCTVTITPDGPFMNQGGQLSVTEIAASTYRVTGSLNPEWHNLEDAYDVNVGINSVACA